MLNYEYIRDHIKGHDLPISAVNEKGESVIVEGNSSCYVTTTFQSNDWCRVNEFYPDGTITETYER